MGRFDSEAIAEYLTTRTWGASPSPELVDLVWVMASRHEEWVRRVVGWRRSGLTAKQYAATIGVNEGTPHAAR
ncbi:MAG TPA: hypothetical protein VEB21_03575 [Terriglobales bacterium]|nr:hypothetical protein [Terriglobales bacterium]